MAPWFGPKKSYDFGIASWQGAVAFLIFLAAFFYTRYAFRPADFGWPKSTRATLVVAEIIAMVVVMWVKYDRERD